MIHSKIVSALETLQVAGTISAGWVVRGEEYELAPGDSITPEQFAEALATWEATIGQLKIWRTVADFWNEFSTGEQYAIQVSTDATIIVARGQLAMWRGEVWSDDPRVTGALDALVPATILTPERKTQILAK